MAMAVTKGQEENERELDGTEGRSKEELSSSRVTGLLACTFVCAAAFELYCSKLSMGRSLVQKAGKMKDKRVVKKKKMAKSRHELYGAMHGEGDRMGKRRPSERTCVLSATKWITAQLDESPCVHFQLVGAAAANIDGGGCGSARVAAYA